MKGRMHKTVNGWCVEYNNGDLPLHPDDVEQITKDSLIFDNIEARITAYPDVEFEILEVNINQSLIYAKLI